jgi:hypothetical protein
VASRLVPHLAADVVQRTGGEHHHVERVDTPDGLRGALSDRSADPTGHVRTDQLQCFAALFSELVEEREHRPAVAARCGPHQPATVMIDHDGQVPLSLAVADLIDPDPPQPVEEIDLTPSLGGDPFKDRPDRSPRDTLKLSDRGPRRVHR